MLNPKTLTTVVYPGLPREMRQLDSLLLDLLRKLAGWRHDHTIWPICVTLLRHGRLLQNVGLQKCAVDEKKISHMAQQDVVFLSTSLPLHPDPPPSYQQHISTKAVNDIRQVR